MMCQYRVIHCNKCTTLMGVVSSGGDYAYVGAGSRWKSLTLPVSSEHNTILKMSSLSFKTKQ